MEHGWALIRTKPAAEAKVADALRFRLGDARKADVYFPLERAWRGVGRRRRKHDRPLIRGFVFAALSDFELSLLHNIEGAGGPMIVDGKAARLHPKLIHRMQKAEAGGWYDTTVPRHKRKPLEAGERVTIKAGHLKGFEAVVTEMAGQGRVRALLAISNAMVNVDLGNVELTEEPAPPVEAMPDLNSTDDDERQAAA